MSDDSKMIDAAERQKLNADLSSIHCRVHDPSDPPLFTRQPDSPMQACHWKWTDLWPMLERLGQKLAIGSGGNRRTLRLAPPGLPYGTTPTFWGSIQVVMPGEVAAAHRHSANAFRWITHGSGITTSTVDGERYEMHQGDLVLTPPMMWHDHQYEGTEPMVWLDGLDISIMRSVHASFFDPYPAAQQPVLDVCDASYRSYGSGLMRPPGPPARTDRNPLLVYPREMSERALELAAGLEPDPFDDTILEFQNPLDGGSALKTLAMCLQRLRPGLHGKARRNTGSKLYQVVRGSGATIVGGRVFEWETGDYFVVPPWNWHEHINRSDAEAVLFQVNDIPTLKALGYYYEEALGGSGHQ